MAKAFSSAIPKAVKLEGGSRLSAKSLRLLQVAPRETCRAALGGPPFGAELLTKPGLVSHVVLSPDASSVGVLRGGGWDLQALFLARLGLGEWSCASL